MSFYKSICINHLNIIFIKHGVIHYVIVAVVFSNHAYKDMCKFYCTCMICFVK